MEPLNGIFVSVKMLQNAKIPINCENSAWRLHFRTPFVYSLLWFFFWIITGNAEFFANTFQRMIRCHKSNIAES